MRDRIGAEIHRRITSAVGPDAEPRIVSALEMTFFGALVNAGSGAFTYHQIADRPRLRGRPHPGDGSPMTLQIDKPLLDPYDYDFHEDPYPYYQRLRDEAPLYRNEELGFWALSRHADVHQGFRNSTTLSNRFGVSLDPASRGPHASKTMSFLAMDDPAHLRLRTLVSKGFTPRRIRELEPRVTEIATQHLDIMLEKATSGTGRLRRRIRRKAADGRHLRADGRPRRPTATGCGPGPTASCTATKASPTCRPRRSRHRST